MGTGKKMINTTLRLALLIIVIIGAFAAAGCIFDSTEIGKDPEDEGKQYAHAGKIRRPNQSSDHKLQQPTEWLSPEQ